MQVILFNEQSSYSLNLENLQRLVEEVLKLENCECNEVIIHFVEESEICQLHDEFFDDPSPTDCITFPMDETEGDEYRVLGEVFVCPKAAFDYTSINGGDSNLELTLYVVHGLLHLLGYDDISTRKRAKMRAAEKRHLDHLQEEKLTLALQRE
ncbi:MAG: rRNA maturation RNase YbeY [Parachlamydiales bacterium]|nr:rRNA maturation RNase YbeY [Parachlamydiales bacterium]